MVEDIERNIKHQCARYAYDCIEDMISEPADRQREYRSEVMSTGTRIHGSGLLQTLTFYCSKMSGKGDNEKPHFRKLALHMLKWILKDEKIDGGLSLSEWNEDVSGVWKLYSVLLNADSDEKMIFYTERARELTDWLKRFADARLKEG